MTIYPNPHFTYYLDKMNKTCWIHLEKKNELISDTRWNDKIVILKKTTLQLYFKTFIEKNQFR